jgi:ATP-binding cassette subfamily F protein uup
MNLLSVENISKSFGDRKLFEGLHFGLADGQKMALIARNGTGKTTLMEMLAGREQPDTGRITYRKGIKLGYLPQEPELNLDKSILDNVLDVDNAATRAVRNYEAALADPGNADRYQKAFDDMERQGAWDFEAQVKQVLGVLGLHETSQKVKELSGGQRKRVALARTLISQPDLLILDEPTNHLDVIMIEWLEEYLGQTGITLFMVTHDRYFLERVCDVILEMDDGNLYQHPGNYSKFLERRAERQEVEATNVGKARNLMRKELEWIRRQPKARGTKSKARIDAFHDIKKEANRDLREKELALDIKMTRLGSKILELHRLRKNYGEKKILAGFDYIFKRRERVGIVGPNGVGKTTFLRLLTGREDPDGGKIVTGETVKFGFYTQSGINLAEDKRVIDVVKEIAEVIPVGRKGGDITASQMLERFLFEGDQQYTYVSKLSGGEKRRLYLLTILMANPNFLILDEPTNDLDIISLNVLEDFLLEFEGCLVIVTHDRYFMDKLTDHLFVFEGEGKIRDFPGNYSEYRDQEEREEELLRRREKSIAKTKTENEKPAEKTKLTYGERLEMAELELQIEKMEARKAEIASEFETATLDAGRLEILSRELNEITGKLEEKEMRWLELSEYDK